MSGNIDIAATGIDYPDEACGSIGMQWTDVRRHATAFTVAPVRTIKAHIDAGFASAPTNARSAWWRSLPSAPFWSIVAGAICFWALPSAAQLFLSQEAGGLSGQLLPITCFFGFAMLASQNARAIFALSGATRSGQRWR